MGVLNSTARTRPGAGVGATPRPRRFDTRQPGIAERLGLAHLDPLLAVAAIGLIALSIFTLAASTKDEVAGDPYFYVVRQVSYAVLGIAAISAV